MLHDRHVVLVLFEHELDDFKAQGHVTGFVRLRREAEGHGGHIAVVRRARHERHEQQVGQHIFERERNRGQKLERAGRAGVVKERLGHRQKPDPVVHVGKIVQTIKVLVVVAHGVQLGLHMTQLVNRLHLAGYPRTGPAEMPADLGIALKRAVFQRRNTGQKQLEGVNVARIGNVLVAVVLGEGVEDSVQLLLFFGLILPVGIHGQAERVFPLVPVGDLDPLKAFVGEDVLLLLVARFPGHVAGQVLVLVFEAELLVLGSHEGSPSFSTRE